MRTTGLRVEGLPENPLDAAAMFHAEFLPEVRGNPDAADMIVVYFQPAGHEHRAWRLAAVQELAREVVPARANAIVGGSFSAKAATLDYLAHAPGVTGQVLELDDAGMAPVIASPS